MSRTRWKGPLEVEVIEADGSTGTLDLVATLWRARGLQAMREARGTTRRLPQLNEVVVRRRSDEYCSGRAWPTLQRMVLSIGQQQTRERVEELVLHELLHLALPSRHHHGPRFRSGIIAACREWWPDCPSVWEVRNEGRVYGIDDQLWAAARRDHVLGTGVPENLRAMTRVG